MSSPVSIVYNSINLLLYVNLYVYAYGFIGESGDIHKPLSVLLI